MTSSNTYSRFRTEEEADPEPKSDLWAEHEKSEAEKKKKKMECTLHHKKCSKAICKVFSDMVREANRAKGQGGGGDGPSRRGNDRGGRGRSADSRILSCLSSFEGWLLISF